MVRAHA